MDRPVVSRIVPLALLVGTLALGAGLPAAAAPSDAEIREGVSEVVWSWLEAVEAWWGRLLDSAPPSSTGAEGAVTEHSVVRSCTVAGVGESSGPAADPDGCS